ncbi:MAG: integrase [Bacteroidetes bacterium]|nr:MAG: integrase [Bacteroidota bacterium]
MDNNNFFQYLETEKRCSIHTLRAYKVDLAQFFSFITKQFQVEGYSGVKPVMIRSWIVSMMDKGISPRSINRKISSLKSLFRFLSRENIITDNPVLKVIAPKASQSLPVFVDKRGMELLLDEIEFVPGFRGMRDKLVIEMLYFTGVRLSELIGMDEKNVDLVQGQIKVLGKRNKERIIPINSILVQSIINYIEVRNREIGKDGQDNYLFLTEKGNKMYEKLVYRIVNTYLGKVSTIVKKSPHILRHTFATHMLNNGANLNTIKEILGHSNLAATQIYTHNTIDKLKLIYEQAHPRA